MSRASLSLKCVLVVLLVLAAAGTSHAGPAPRVLVIDGGSSSLARKLRAELAYGGLEVIDPSVADSDADDADLLASGACDAFLRVLSERNVQVFISGSRAHDAYSQNLLARPSEEAFPLRVVEELRARLVELGFELPDDTEQPNAPSAVTAPTPLTAPAASVTTPASAVVASDRSGSSDADEQPFPVVLGASVGVGGIVAAGGLGPALTGVLGVRAQLGSALGLRLAASLPLSNNGTSAPEGEVEVLVTTFSLEAEYTSQLGSGWALSTGLGAGVVLLGMHTEAEAPFVARDRSLRSGLYFVQFGLARELTDWLRLRASLSVGVSGPRQVLRFDDREVASWGPGFGTFTLDTEIGWRVTGGHSP